MKLPPTLAMAVHAIPGERGCQAAKTASRSETILRRCKSQANQTLRPDRKRGDPRGAAPAPS
jgi:hypothetical protein